jgi:hypothetical protein
MIRRRCLALIFAGALAAPLSLPAQGGPTDSTPAAAQVLVAAAIHQAKLEHKLVLVKFGASWCGWCHRFDDFLADSGVGRIMSAHFVIVGMTTLEVPAKKALENPGSAELMKAMGGGGGLPFFFVLDTSGRKLGDANIMPGGSNVGHPNTPAEVAAFDTLLARVAPAITPAERARIRAYFDRIAGRSGA